MKRLLQFQKKKVFPNLESGFSPKNITDLKLSRSSPDTPYYDTTVVAKKKFGV